MKIKGGYTNYGQDIGILMLETVFPRIIGDIGNARTFDFPVRYRVVRNIFNGNTLPSNAEELLLKSFIAAAQSLEAEGCKAITTSCGFLAGFQRELADAVNIPVFTTVLSLVPMIYPMINRDKKIGIFTEQKEHLTEGLFNKAGFSSTTIPVCVSSLPEGSAFSELVISDHVEGNLDHIKSCIVEMAQAHMEAHPDTGAIVLECQNFSPYSDLIQEVCGVPVFGINQLVEFISSCINVRSY